MFASLQANERSLIMIALLDRLLIFLQRLEYARISEYATIDTWYLPDFLHWPRR